MEASLCVLCDYVAEEACPCYKPDELGYCHHQGEINYNTAICYSEEMFKKLVEETCNEYKLNNDAGRNT